MLRRLCPVCCAALCACGPSEVDATAGEVDVVEPRPPQLSRTTTVAESRLPVDPAPPPDGWTDLRALPGLRFDIVYAREDNFTGARVPGYASSSAWLHADAAAALLRAHQSLAARGLGLIVFDAYRPQRASEHFVHWARRSGREHLVRDGYIAKRSLHNRGVAVDLGLYTLANGAVVDMGSQFDTFDTTAHFTHAQGPARDARKDLRDAMSAEGFRPYAKEWWHFTYAPPGFEAPEPLDRPYPPRGR